MLRFGDWLKFLLTVNHDNFVLLSVFHTQQKSFWEWEFERMRWGNLERCAISLETKHRKEIIPESLYITCYVFVHAVHPWNSLSSNIRNTVLGMLRSPASLRYALGLLVLCTIGGFPNTQSHSSKWTARISAAAAGLKPDSVWHQSLCNEEINEARQVRDADKMLNVVM